MAHSVICFGEDWGRHPGSAQDIMERLSTTRKVLWVDSLGLRIPRLTLEDGKRIIVKIKNFLVGARLTGESIIVVTPLVLPYHKWQIVRWVNNMILTVWLKRLIRKHQLLEPVLWISCPAAAGVVGRLGEVKSIYYCADEHSVFPGLSKTTVEHLEKKLLKTVDLVVVTSTPLYETKKAFNPKIVQIPHGVDFDHFSKAANPHIDVPRDICRIKKPIIGFYGLIQDLIDFDLIRYVAKTRPEWSIVMIGPTIFDVGDLPRLPNIHFMGGRSREQLPNYVKSFDVCMIPYKVVERTIYANPLKLRQYLSSGRPVVSTPLPEVKKYEGLVKIAKDPADYVRHIEFLLDHDTPKDARRRMDAVRGEDWGGIIKRIEALL